MNWWKKQSSLEMKTSMHTILCDHQQSQTSQGAHTSHVLLSSCNVVGKEMVGGVLGVVAATARAGTHPV